MYLRVLPVLVFVLAALIASAEVSNAQEATALSSPQPSVTSPTMPPKPEGQFGAPTPPMMGPNGEKRGDFSQPPQGSFGSQPQPPQGFNGGMSNEFGGSKGMPQGTTQFGPSEEEMNKRMEQEEKRQAEMEKKRDEQQKKMEEQQKKQMEKGLKQMKTGAKQMVKFITSIKKRIESLAAKNIPVSEELKQAVAADEATLAKLDAVQDLQEGADLVTEVQEHMDMYREEMPKLEQLAVLPQILKRADQEYVKLKKASDKSKNALKKAGSDYADLIAEVDAKVAEIRSAIDDAKKGKVVEGAENIIESLQMTAFEKFEDAWQMIGSLEAVRTFKQTITRIDRQIKSNDKIIANLTKRKEDVAEAKEVQVKIKAHAAVLKGKVKVKDPDELFDLLTTYSELQQEFEDAVGETQRDNAGDNVTPNSKNGFGVPKFDIPGGLPGSSSFDERSIDGLKNSAPFMP